jgi:hypothetical protein
MRHLLASSAMLAALLLPVPVGTATAASLSVRFTALRTPVARGGTASATVHTATDALCVIRVVYGGVRSHAPGLGARYASPNGNVSWAWTVPRSTPTGSAPVAVTCQSGTRIGQATRTMDVTR